MTPSPIKMTIRWNVTASEARLIAATLQHLMMHTRTELGCTGCSVSTQMAPNAHVDYVEEWDTERDLQHQIRSDRFSNLAELIERATNPPVVTFSFPDGTTRGLDYPEEVRQSPDLS